MSQETVEQTNSEHGKKLVGISVLGIAIGSFFYAYKKGIIKIPQFSLFGGSKPGIPDVTSVKLLPQNGIITDGSQLTLSWSITGGSGDFSGQIAWGDGTIDNISGTGSTLVHKYDIRNSLSQVISIILTLKDQKSGLDYRQNTQITVNPVGGQSSGTGGTVSNPAILIDAGTVSVDSGDRLHVPVTYENLSQQSVNFIAIMQYVDSFGIVRALSTINFSLNAGQTSPIEFVTNVLPAELFTRASQVQLYAWVSRADPQALATEVTVNLTASEL